MILLKKENFAHLFTQYELSKVNEIIKNEFNIETENRSQEELVDLLYDKYLTKMKETGIYNMKINKDKNVTTKESVKIYIYNLIKINLSMSFNQILDSVCKYYSERYFIRGKKPLTRVKNCLRVLEKENKIERNEDLIKIRSNNEN